MGTHLAAEAVEMVHLAHGTDKLAVDLLRAVSAICRLAAGSSLALLILPTAVLARRARRPRRAWHRRSSLSDVGFLSLRLVPLRVVLKRSAFLALR